jgi:8-oxo-dGTP pyrophosphatase MutT (NUDIX family)
MVQTAPARPSSSVILVRDGEAGLETFMVRRHARSPVAPSAYVFPGGTVRDDDARTVDGLDLSDALSARSDTPIEPRTAGEYFACAVRELFEEAGVLLVRDASGALLEVDESDVVLQERLATARLAMQSRELSLIDLVGERGWVPAWEELVPFSHWVTPVALAARFDTRFFVAAMPARQAALHCTIETSEGAWLPPRALLDGDYRLVFATAAHLRRLAAFDSVADLLGFAREKPIRRVQPTLVEDGKGLRAAIADEVVDRW